MRQIFISGLILISAVATAAASDRYPGQKRYVNQTGQVVTLGHAAQVMAYAPVRSAIALPPVQIVPVAEAVVQPRLAPRLVALKPQHDGLFGSINADPANWPSGRTCCRPGEPYFNENPES